MPLPDDLARSVQLFEKWLALLANQVAEDVLNRSRAEGRLDIESLSLDELEEFVRLGNTAAITIDRGGWSLRLDGRPPGGFAIEAEGEIEQAFGDDLLDRARAAVAALDVAGLLAVCEGSQATVQLELINRPMERGIHWIRRATALQEILAHRWDGLLPQVIQSGQRGTIAVDDAAGSRVVCPALEILGPDATVADVAFERSRPTADYAKAYLDTSDRMPEPLAIEPEESNGLEEVVKLLKEITLSVCWYWLAEQRAVHDGIAQIRFNGARITDISLPLIEVSDLRSHLELWSWATANTDPDRRQAVQQAASLAIFGPNDVAEAAVPVLRTAQSLYELARRGAVAEALSTRRTAREAATAAARAAADAARTATGKAIDRVVLQLAALAGILIAQSKQALDPIPAARLSAVIFVLLLITFLISVRIDFPGAAAVLESFDLDLGQYREALGDKDIQAIRELDSLKRAKSQLNRAKRSAIVLFLICLGATAYITSWLLDWQPLKLFP